MSDQQPQQPAVLAAAQAPEKASKLPLILTIVGLSLFALAAIVKRIVKVEGDPTAGADVAEILVWFGASFASFGKPLPVPAAVRNIGPGAGPAVSALVVGAIAAFGAAALPGCASTTRHGDEVRFVLEDHPRRPAPACHYRLTVDGDLVVEGNIDECPAAPVCEDRP